MSPTPTSMSAMIESGMLVEKPKAIGAAASRAKPANRHRPPERSPGTRAGTARHDRECHAGGEAESDPRRGHQREAREQPQASRTLHRNACQYRGGDQRAKRGGAAQHAGAPGVDAENVAGVKRQQRLYA